MSTEPCMEKPQSEHEWFNQLIGEWTYEGECAAGEGEPAMISGGTETVRSLGGFWMIAEGKSQMPDGTPASMIMTLGYDPKTKRYVGTWIGSMMTKMWIYDGEMDSSGKILTLNSDGPNFTDPTKSSKYQDIIELVDSNTRVLRSQTLGDDGKWNQFMKATYKRTP